MNLNRIHFAQITLTLIALDCAVCHAGNPSVVHFDAQPLSACVDVTTPEFATQNPLDKLVAARLDISLLVTGKNAPAIDEVIYYVHAVEQRALVLDYSPKTTLATDVVGNIRVSTEKRSGGGVQVGAGAKLESTVSADASYSNSSNEAALHSFEKLPGRDVVTTSGTIARGSGVYFKFHRNAQNTLEGEQCLTIVLQVPYDWRADYVRVVCRASARSRHGNTTLANQSLLIPLYLEGDLAARSLATQLLHTQQQLLSVVDQEHRAIERRRLPTLAHELSLADPKIPQDWLESVLWARSGQAHADYVNRLPDRVRDALQLYQYAKQAVSVDTKRPVESVGQLATSIRSHEGVEPSSRTTVLKVPTEEIDIKQDPAEPAVKPERETVTEADGAL